MNKPIGIKADDKFSYGDSRGFIDEVEKYYTGFDISDFDSFIKFVEQVKYGRFNFDYIRASEEAAQNYDTKGNNSLNLLKYLNILK